MFLPMPPVMKNSRSTSMRSIRPATRWAMAAQ